MKLDNVYFLPNNGADISGFIISDSSSLIMSTIACASGIFVEPATSSCGFWLFDEEGRVSTEMRIGFVKNQLKDLDCDIQ